MYKPLVTKPIHKDETEIHLGLTNQTRVSQILVKALDINHLSSRQYLAKGPLCQSSTMQQEIRRDIQLEQLMPLGLSTAASMWLGLSFHMLDLHLKKGVPTSQVSPCESHSTIS